MSSSGEKGLSWLHTTHQTRLRHLTLQPAFAEISTMGESFATFVPTEHPSPRCFFLSVFVMSKQHEASIHTIRKAEDSSFFDDSKLSLSTQSRLIGYFCHVHYRVISTFWLRLVQKIVKITLAFSI